MIRRRELDIDVVEAARQRIIRTFAKGRQINLSFSGGKDSLVLGHIIYQLILEGKIDKSLLHVIFIDEEAMYDDVIEIVKDWRIKFMQEGVKFIWYCLPVKHFNCLNTMTDEETFICWDPRKKDCWVREMPPFAVTDDEFLIPFKDNYQSFLERKEKANGTTSIRGVRVAESIQRRKNIAHMKDDRIVLPIYDMTDKDIWLYIRKYGIEYPKTYENLYRIGTPKNQLRISQFFSIDTAKSLVSLGEMYPDLMERVTRREPNAYLCAMYWDTEMFGKNTRKRKELEKDVKRDYRKEVFELMRDPNAEHKDLIKELKPYIIKGTHCMDDTDWKNIYEVLLTGDPKHRKKRAIVVRIFGKEKS